MSTAAKADLARSAQLFHALSDETRLGILKMLGSGECCVCDLQDAFNAAQSRLSYHLKILKTAGLVADRQEGRWSYYRIEINTMAEVRMAAESLAEVADRSGFVNPGKGKRSLPVADRSGSCCTQGLWLAKE